MSRRDWLASPLDEAYTMYSQPAPSQPMVVQAPNGRRYTQHQLGQADAAPLAMRNNVRGESPVYFQQFSAIWGKLSLAVEHVTDK